MEKKTMYGFPISSIFLQISLMIFFILLLFLTVLNSFLLGTALLLCIIILFWYVFIYNFKKRFLTIRKKIVHQMINLAQLTGSEYILDLGTGSGFIAIEFSKYIHSGNVIGIDKYDKNTPVLGSNFFEELKINFFGHKLNQAKKNALLEHQLDKLSLVKSDLKKHFPFPNQSFNIILSSQFLYCIPQKNIDFVLSEIDRVLQPSGQLIFFESKKFLYWNIGLVDDFFKKLNYETHLHPLKEMSNKCIFSAYKIKQEV